MRETLVDAIVKQCRIGTALLLLVLGGVSAAVSLLGAQWALLLLGAMGVLGTFWSWKLKEVE
mgnify:CR=1 FL=1